MIIEIAEDLDRLALARPRSELWGGPLSTAQYAERNIRLYAHPFGKAKIITWLARNNDGNLLTSLDTFEVKFRSGKEIVTGYHIASVYTPPDQRGHDHARKLLSTVLSKNPSALSILFSDLRPSYYEKLGYESFSMRENILSAQAVDRRGLETALDSKSFVKELANRKEFLTKPGVTVEYDELYLDWHIERFRYFSELTQKRLPTEIFWIGEHSGKLHPIASIPNFVSGNEEGMVLDGQCSHCINFLVNQAVLHGLPSARFWVEDRVAPNKIPMIRNAAVPWVDRQALDYW
ncbi:MAG: GNAT family N-acetyltransferase [Deltaproteobacteria bacterium]|nr:GNAT family N-acetyltransferase [Deltaproteobacteria bacterium]MBI3293642.1 GNAT family N-acetyltransferase [Deltaproteobacteria bacterium]